jgi:HAMP domain-containing protein
MGLRRFTSLARRLVWPRRTARRRLAILYGGLFLLSGILLLAITGTLAVRSTSRAVSPAPAQSQQSELQARIQQLQLQLASQASQQHATVEHQLLIGSAIGLGVMAVMSVLLGVLVAGRVLRPLREMTDTTRRISADNLHERLAMPGPRDELKDLADTIDGLLERLEGAFAMEHLSWTARTGRIIPNDAVNAGDPTARNAGGPADNAAPLATRPARWQRGPAGNAADPHNPGAPGGLGGLGGLGNPGSPDPAQAAPSRTTRLVSGRRWRPVAARPTRPRP